MITVQDHLLNSINTIAETAQASARVHTVTLDEDRDAFTDGVTYALAVLTGADVHGIRRLADEGELVNCVRAGSVLTAIDFLLEDENND